MKVAQLYLTACDPVDYTVDGTLQARILEWAHLPFSRGIFPTQSEIEPRSPALQADSFPSEPPGKPLVKAKNQSSMMTTSQIIQVLFSHLKRIGVCVGGGGGVAVGDDILKEWLKKKKVPQIPSYLLQLSIHHPLTYRDSLTVLFQHVKPSFIIRDFFSSYAGFQVFFVQIRTCNPYSQ